MAAFLRKKKQARENIRPVGWDQTIEQPLVTSREFRLFMEKDRKRLSWFEFLAGGAGRILKVNPDSSSGQEIENAINFTGMRITPQDVMALVVLTMISFAALGIILAVAGIIQLVVTLFVIMGGVGLGYYFLKYPNNQLKVYRIKASSQVVLAVLYMVVSMRVSPNLESSLRFSAANVSGPLAWDMRRLLWDIEMGKYYSASHALTDYIAKWKPENEEFAEALRLIRDSTTQSRDRVDDILDESLRVILDGTKTRMKHYAQELSMPVTIIHMMGIILPVLGSIMAPMAAIFLSDMVKAEHFILGYDIILPIFIVWFINTVLKKRPTTFSEVDTSMHPELPPKGTFSMKMGKRRVFVPALPVSLIIASVLIIPPVMFFVSTPGILFPVHAIKAEHTMLSMLMSLMITLGVAVGLGSYFLLTTFQAIKVQRETQSTESEFELALFQLGNRISGGTPTEVALEKSIDDVKDLSIAGLFTVTLRNIRNLGMTFSEAIFNEKWGAIRYYPSKLITNIMYMIVDISKRGVKYAAEGMLTVSKYLRNIRETQEYIRDLLSESVSSMMFQAYMLTPLITGLIVAMSQIIINVLTALGNRLASISTDSSGFQLFNVSGLFGTNVETAVSPEIFQLIIGIYLIEVVIILAMFITKITQGENSVHQWNMAGKMLIVSVVMYFMVALGASFMFGGLIENALSGLG